MDTKKIEGEDFGFDEYEHETDDERLQRLRDKWNPVLLESAMSNNCELFKEAYDNGAEINYADRKKWDGILWASCSGSYQVLKLFAKNGALAFYNLNPYHRTSRCDFYDIRLGKFNEKPDNSPLQWASLKGNSECVAFLIKEGFNWQKLDQFYSNCFHLAASSNNVETTEIYLQTGVNINLKNSRNHTAYDITSEPAIKQLLQRCKETKECKLAKREFRDNEIKFLCKICKEFFCIESCNLVWVYDEETDTEMPLSRCVDCFEVISIAERKAKTTMDAGNLSEIKQLYKKFMDTGLQIGKKIRRELEDSIKKYTIVKELNAKIDKLGHNDTYKTIKKQVALLQGKLSECEQDGIELPIATISKVEKTCKRLNAERDLRFYMEIAEKTDESVQTLKKLVDDAMEGEVEKEYTDVANEKLIIAQRFLRVNYIHNLFTEYPVREYPPDPIWDKRGKRWIDAVTKKPIDPKKPQILPLNPPKKKKKKKKKGQKEEPEYVIPEWAEDRKTLIAMYKELEELIKFENLGFDEKEKADIKKELERMQKENKYRNRIELDLKIIEEHNAKNAKNKKK